MLCRWWQGSSKTAQQWRMGCFLPAWGALKLILQLSNVTDVNEIFDFAQPGGPEWLTLASFRWTWFNGNQRSLIILSSFFALCVVECCVYCRWKTWALWVAGWTRNWIGIWTWIRAMARIVQVCGQFQSEGAIFNPNISCHRILVLRTFKPPPEDLGTAWQPPLWFDQVWEPKQLSISQLTLFLSLSRLQANIS